MKQLIAILSVLLLGLPVLALAQDDMQSRDVEATVDRIVSDRTVEGNRQMVFEAVDGLGVRYTVDTSESYVEGLRFDIRPGDRVSLVLLPDGEGGYDAQLADVIRTGRLLVIGIVFSVLTVAIGLWRGASALVGLFLTLGVLFGAMLPAILHGRDPLLVTVLGCVVILAVNMHLSHGFRRSTFMAFLATVGGLVVAIVVSKCVLVFSRLSGLASDEAVFLFWQHEPAISPGSLLLSGFILGTVGVLDDIAIAQSEAVRELRVANPKLGRRDLFAAAMRLGRHHIASTVNTLAFAYAGAALPLFLLFMSSAVSWKAFMNTELIAEELVRTAAGTLSLLLTVPIATWFAVAGQRENPSEHA
jgi:uncharacterized membrane protein